jgi:hypothetical protein
MKNKITFEKLHHNTDSLDSQIIQSKDILNKVTAVFSPKSIGSVWTNIAKTCWRNKHLKIDLISPLEVIKNRYNLIKQKIITNISENRKLSIEIRKNAIILLIKEK